MRYPTIEPSTSPARARRITSTRDRWKNSDDGWPLLISLWTSPLARAPPPMIATSDPAGMPMDEMKLRMKTAK